MSDEPRNSLLRYKNVTSMVRKYYRLPVVQTSLSVVLSLFSVAFFIFVAIRPTFVTISELNRTIEDSKATLKKLDTKVNALQQVAGTWTSISPNIKYLDNSIPTGGPRYKVISQEMEIVALESGVTIRGLSEGGAITYSSITDPYSSKNSSVVNMPIIIRVSGTFSGVSEFLTKLNEIDRLVSVDTLSYSKDADNGDTSGGVTFNINGNIHYMADEKLLAPILGTDKEK